MCLPGPKALGLYQVRDAFICFFFVISLVVFVCLFGWLVGWLCGCLFGCLVVWLVVRVVVFVVVVVIVFRLVHGMHYTQCIYIHNIFYLADLPYMHGTRPAHALSIHTHPT